MILRDSKLDGNITSWKVNCQGCKYYRYCAFVITTYKTMIVHHGIFVKKLSIKHYGIYRVFT